MVTLDVLVLLDTGYDISVMTSRLCDRFPIPTIVQETLLHMLDLVGKKVVEACRAFTCPVEFIFEEYTYTLSFEIARTDMKFDMILYYIWMAKYRINVYKDKLTFSGELCNSVCRKGSTKFMIKYDNSVTQEVYTYCMGVVASNNPERDVLLTLKEGLPVAYHKYLDLDTAQQSEKLLPYQTVDHAINFVPHGRLLQGPIYLLSETELEKLQKYIDKIVW